MEFSSRDFRRVPVARSKVEPVLLVLVLQI